MQSIENSPEDHIDPGSETIFWKDNYKESMVADYITEPTDSVYFRSWRKGDETAHILLHYGKSWKTQMPGCVPLRPRAVRRGSMSNHITDFYSSYMKGTVG